MRWLFARIDVKADDLKSGRDQAAGIDLAHETKADDADGILRSPWR